MESVLVSDEAIVDTVLDLLVENEEAKGAPRAKGERWVEGVSYTDVCRRLGLMDGRKEPRPTKAGMAVVRRVCAVEPGLTAGRRVTIQVAA